MGEGDGRAAVAVTLRSAPGACRVDAAAGDRLPRMAMPREAQTQPSTLAERVTRTTGTML
jgi:hypothetical protein